MAKTLIAFLIFLLAQIALAFPLERATSLGDTTGKLDNPTAVFVKDAQAVGSIHNAPSVRQNLVLPDDDDTSQAIDVSFQVFELKGTISPEDLKIDATLYAKIPIIGRVELVRIQGPLLEGTNFHFDLTIAQGSGKLIAKPNAAGTHDLYISLDANLKLMGNVRFDNLKIATLPF